MTKEDDNKRLCLNLMKTNSEKEVISLLKNANYWNDSKAWRYYGDRASNFNTIGNQQSRPDAALVEKLVNSVDARLINECLLKNINPESGDAPKSIREAVALFFDNGAKSSNAGLVREWPASKRTEIAKGITLCATGYKPSQGNPCFIISDQGEGQTPANLPSTILSLDRENKVKIPFVQGKFNMGGTGVLEFCGKNNLQLVISRRNPKLIKDYSRTEDFKWGFTIVRREEPVSGRKNSVYTFLAPVNSDKFPNKGEVLSFQEDNLNIFPDGNNPYGRSSNWGTLIKLYEYSTSGFSGTNILLADGLMRQLDLLLTELALPIRIHECRDYSGHAGSFDTNLTGIGVRLDDDKASNLEDDPYSCSMNILGERMTASIYVFKKGKEKTYRQNEGVIFSLNGQTHGYLSTNFFRRKNVSMGYLADSILVIVNCSDLSARSREILFMPSRDRLRGGELKLKIESELEEIIGNHQGLKKLREKRRQEEVESILNDEKPLSELLKELIKDSPALAQLFLTGQKLPNPFNLTHKSDDNQNPYIGKRFPTYFKFQDQPYHAILNRNCHINYRARILFETDAENSYFQREVQPGSFRLYVKSSGEQVEVDHTINLWNGIASLNLTLPHFVNIGDKIEFLAITEDDTRVEPFTNTFLLTILAPADKGSGGEGKRRKPPSKENGGDREYPSGIELPNIIRVAKTPEEKQKSWDEMSPSFDEYSAIRIINVGRSSQNETDNGDKVIYDFYVNIDNIYIRTELKRNPSQSEINLSKYIYAQVLIGLSIINYDIQHNSNKTEDETSETLEEKVEKISKAVAPVIIPIINDLGQLEISE